MKLLSKNEKQTVNGNRRTTRPEPARWGAAAALPTKATRRVKKTGLNNMFYEERVLWKGLKFKK
jgi:hypothetical protein